MHSSIDGGTESGGSNGKGSCMSEGWQIGAIPVEEAGVKFALQSSDFQSSCEVAVLKTKSSLLQWRWCCCPPLSRPEAIVTLSGVGSRE